MNSMALAGLQVTVGCCSSSFFFTEISQSPGPTLRHPGPWGWYASRVWGSTGGCRWWVRLGKESARNSTTFWRVSFSRDKPESSGPWLCLGRKEKQNKNTRNEGVTFAFPVDRPQRKLQIPGWISHDRIIAWSDDMAPPVLNGSKRVCESTQNQPCQ